MIVKYMIQPFIPKWGRTSVDDQELTARALFTEENTDEEM